MKVYPNEIVRLYLLFFQLFFSANWMTDFARALASEIRRLGGRGLCLLGMVPGEETGVILEFPEVKAGD